MNYTIWSTNRFNDDLLQKIVAKFSELNLARDFVEYQATLGNSYAVVDKDGKRIEM